MVEVVGRLVLGTSDAAKAFERQVRKANLLPWSSIDFSMFCTNPTAIVGAQRAADSPQDRESGPLAALGASGEGPPLSDAMGRH